MGGERENIEFDFNQLARTRSKNRLVVTVGNFAVSDIFDASSTAHDARTQFLTGHCSRMELMILQPMHVDIHGAGRLNTAIAIGCFVPGDSCRRASQMVYPWIGAFLFTTVIRWRLNVAINGMSYPARYGCWYFAMSWWQGLFGMPWH